MEIDYSTLTTEEMETLVKNLNEQIEVRRTSLVDGILNEVYPYVAKNSTLVKTIEGLPYELRNKCVDDMVEDFDELYTDISHYVEDLTLEDILVLLRIAIESYHNNL